MYNLNGTAAKATLERNVSPGNANILEEGRRFFFFLCSLPFLPPVKLKRVVSERETETRERFSKEEEGTIAVKTCGKLAHGICKWAAE